MNETLEQRLRESMEHRVADLPASVPAPAGLLRRTRRRQVVVGTLTAVTVIAVVVSSFLGVRELWTGAQTPAGGRQQTGTVNGVTVSYPAGWHFENAMAGTHGSALFIVANYTPPAPFPSLQDRDVCTATAAVMAVQDHSALGDGSGYPQWPVGLRPGGTRVPGCAQSLVATWKAAGRPFGAAVLFGKDVSVEDRAAMLAVFRGLRFGPATVASASPGPVHVSGGTIIARGTTDGVTWTVSVSGRGNLSLEVETPGQGVGIALLQGPGGQTPTLASSALPLGSGAARTLVFGFVSAKVSSVHIEPTHEIGKLYPIPGNLHEQVFVVATRAGSNATVVAEDEGGKVLDQQPIEAGGPPPSPVRASAKASPLSPTSTP